MNKLAQWEQVAAAEARHDVCAKEQMSITMSSGTCIWYGMVWWNLATPTMVSTVHLSILRKGDATLNYTADLIGFIIDQFIFAFISIIRRSSTGSTASQVRSFFLSEQREKCH